MNHFSDTLAPLLLLAAFLLSLLTFLSPSPIFSSSVALLKISGNTSETSKTVAEGTLATRWDPSAPAPLPRHRMIYARRTSNTSNASNASLALSPPTASGIPVHIFFGPMGACYNINRQDTKNMTCSSPSFTPNFTPLLDDAGIWPTLQSHLPDQFPLAPSATFLGVLLLAAAFSASLLFAAPFHSKKFAALEKRRLRLSKFVVGTGGLGVVLGLVATIALRIELAKTVTNVNEIAGLEALLGNGFNQFWAGWSLGCGGVVLAALALFG